MPHYRFQQIRDIFFLLSGILNIFFYNKKVSFSLVQLPFVRGPTMPKLISGPCSIEKVDPREWRIAIPASLMRVEQRLPAPKPKVVLGLGGWNKLVWAGKYFATYVVFLML